MRQLFTPVVGGILRLLSQQVDLAMKDKKRKINVSPGADPNETRRRNVDFDITSLVDCHCRWVRKFRLPHDIG